MSSVFTKAMVSPPSLHKASFSNEEFSIGNVKSLRHVYRRVSFATHKAIHTCRLNSRAFSAAANVHEQSHTVSQGPKRRGRPKKTGSDHDQERQRHSFVESQASDVDESEDEVSSAMQRRKGHLFKYTQITPEVTYEQFKDEHGVSEAVAKHIAALSKESIRTRGWFTIALSGGSLVKMLKKLVHETDIDWTKWHVLWVDERVVPLTDNESNYKLAMGTFLSKVRIPKDQIHSISYAKEASVVAKRYDQVLRGLVERKVLSLDSSRAFPRFDLILLGIGPDGHIASLFPNSLALAEEKKWVVPVLHSPKPPPQRISFSLPCINAASHVFFVVVGSSKEEVVQRVLERPALPGALPAQMVRPSNGVVTWLVDEAAAANLSVDAWSDPKKFPAVSFSSSAKQ